jgi:hypothetical protein
MTPEWTILNLLIQAVAGVLGAHAMTMVAHEYSFGSIGHSLVGLVAGALSGFFAQQIVMTTISGTGGAMPITDLDADICQAVAGLAVGGIAMLVVGLLRHEMTRTPGK